MRVMVGRRGVGSSGATPRPTTTTHPQAFGSFALAWLEVPPPPPRVSAPWSVPLSPSRLRGCAFCSLYSMYCTWVQYMTTNHGYCFGDRPCPRLHVDLLGIMRTFLGAFRGE